MIHTETHMHTTDVKGKDWLVRRNSVTTGRGKRTTKGKGCENNQNISFKYLMERLKPAIGRV